VPYLSALEVCSRQGAIQVHVYLYLTFTCFGPRVFAVNVVQILKLVPCRQAKRRDTRRDVARRRIKPRR